MTYAVSDVHGRLGPFREVLAKAGYGDGDRLFFVGDAVDRGPDGVGVLDEALSLPGCTFLAGNHEDMMMQAVDPDGVKSRYWFDIWMNNGGGTTWESFLKLPRERRAAILDALGRAPEEVDAEAGGTAFRLVHARPGRDRTERLWGRMDLFLPRTVPGKVVVVGHTPVCHMHPSMSKYLSGCGDHMSVFRGDGFVAIDCGSGLPDGFPKRAVGLLRLDDMAEFYAAV